MRRRGERRRTIARYSVDDGPFLERVFERFPAARDFDPCDCGVTFATIPARFVNPAFHFVIPCSFLRTEARSIIMFDSGCARSCYDGPDAVLVLAERA